MEFYSTLVFRFLLFSWPCLAIHIVQNLYETDNIEFEQRRCHWLHWTCVWNLKSQSTPHPRHTTAWPNKIKWFLKIHKGFDRKTVHIGADCLPNWKYKVIKVMKGRELSNIPFLKNPPECTMYWKEKQYISQIASIHYLPLSAGSLDSKSWKMAGTNSVVESIRVKELNFDIKFVYLRYTTTRTAQRHTWICFSSNRIHYSKITFGQ